MPVTDEGNPTRGRSWIEEVLGRPLEATTPMTSPDVIPERRRFYESLPASESLPALRRVEEVVLRQSSSGPLTAEVYVPEGRGPFPGMVYLHGGAFCIWDAAMVRRQAMRIASGGTVVTSVNYRLAPEHPFPAAVEDAIFAARWLVARGEAFQVTPGPIAIGGDSSGANLAVGAICALAGLEVDPPLDHGELAGQPVDFSAALLLCGVYDFQSRMGERPSAPGTTEIMLNLAYLGPHFLSLHRHPLVSPALAPNLAVLPPAYLSCGDRDATLPQSLKLAQALVRAEVPTTLSVVAGGDHEFLMLSSEQLPAVDGEWARIGDWLDRHTGR